MPDGDDEVESDDRIVLDDDQLRGSRVLSWGHLVLVNPADRDDLQDVLDRLARWPDPIPTGPRGTLFGSRLQVDPEQPAGTISVADAAGTSRTGNLQIPPYPKYMWPVFAVTRFVGKSLTEPVPRSLWEYLGEDE